ncbi:CCR4-NOT transcription complex subunit 6-like [Desmophyllum pertusum]|uniref:CCR4-NOT transcription complex subunit 6-like n=1 Tax=Desmophyllum pertusum TaxID=174260 RepID=A0A9W9YVE2_9CNID|nr:CCR4-NOT transcription complex subunit 6-like [Desmophyllum pertusum]
MAFISAQSVGIVSSLKRAAACLKGAVKLVCNFRTIAGSLVAVGCTLALHSCSSLEEYIDVFNKVVLVASSKLVEISEGSLCFTVQADTPSALKELWDIYKNGTLQNRLQEFLVTEEIKQLASGEDIEVTAYMDEQEYKQAYIDLMLLQNQVPDVNEEEQPEGRCRRNSDSFLCLKPNEDEVALMKLKHAENKWNIERQILEEEVMKLKKETAEAGNKSALGTEGLENVERPRERRRRNSDSDLYCKTRDDEIGESEKESEISPGEEAKYLDFEKLAFVQNYLQNIHETHSMTTETSDSGIRTPGEPSNIEMQDITCKYHLLFGLKYISQPFIERMVNNGLYLPSRELARYYSLLFTRAKMNNILLIIKYIQLNLH